MTPQRDGWLGRLTGGVSRHRDHGRDRGQMFAIGLKAMGALVAAALLVIMFSEMRTETIRPLVLNETNTSATSRAIENENKMWPAAMMGGTIVLVFWGLALGAIRSRGGL